MKITTRHASSSHGIPVILDAAGNPLDYAPGLKAIRAAHGLTTQSVADICGVSRRTVEGWEQGRMPTVAGLNVLGDWLEDQPVD